MIRRTLTLSVATAALAACDATRPPSAPELVDDAPLAAVQTTWPTAQDPGLPFYVRVEPVAPYLYVVDETAVFVFYRDPSCIRPDFNLLNFFDPGPAFACRSHVSGTSIWAEDVGIGAPKKVTLRGDGNVPVWFVPASAARDAIADGELTIGELAELPGRLIGTATRFNEVLLPHPLPPFLGGGGHPNPKITTTAHGEMADGRKFTYSLSRHDYDEPHSIRMDIR